MPHTYIPHTDSSVGGGLLVSNGIDYIRLISLSAWEGFGGLIKRARSLVDIFRTVAVAVAVARTRLINLLYAQ